jgi:hypothetical protein
MQQDANRQCTEIASKKRQFAERVKIRGHAKLKAPGIATPNEIATRARFAGAG